jgi:hypothetical protein
MITRGSQRAHDVCIILRLRALCKRLLALKPPPPPPPLLLLLLPAVISDQ